MKRWEGRVALVTGASSGIGAAVAERLFAAGMKVVVTGRREERLAAMVEGRDGLAVAGDLRDEAFIDELFRQTRARHGGVDVLVNAAGLGHDAPLLGGSTAAWREMLEVNVLALCVCTREAVADMRRRGDDGHVVHISSMAGHRVPGGSGVYSATKFAVRSLTEGLRQELRALDSGCRVTAISPGIVATEFHARLLGDAEEAQRHYERSGALAAEDVAESVIHVLAAPPTAEIHDVLMRPTRQTS
ncbi:MAG: short-chain dehydrogenase [Sandaracinus sp.]|nr:short-chain dehydrogenase [Sandaracinus sp.]|tara:strand:- start:4 stop:738 length:735 start_codon:yes stop_codon:yes gene_type:complete